MTYYTRSMEIYEKGRYLRLKKDNSLITVDYVEISTKGGKLVYKVYSQGGQCFDINELND